ncbi:MAG: glycosyltransferase [Verrucomicrobia bacterium]|nr:glycosyltransferase [Verrucomicrobiota bacterium]
MIPPSNSPTADPPASPSARRKLLIISPHFPPVNAPDMHRARLSLPCYRAHGWEPIVLCVGDAWQNATREPELDATVPPDVRVVRVPALPVAWTRLVGVRNLGLRCWLHFLRHGSRLITRERIDLVFFTNTQFFTFTLGRIWRRLHGTPYVFDMQDPWRTDYYERPGTRKPPGGWKYQFARLIAWLAEGWSFRRVSGIMSVSPGYLADLRARYGVLATTPAAVIGFGASRGDLEQSKKLPAPAHRYPRAAGELHFVYTGAAGPVTPHAITVLFDGLRRYRERSPERARRLRFHFLGTSYVAPGCGQNSVLPFAEACGVADQVAEIPHRLGHLECLRLQAEADALLLPGSSDPAYSPSKIYPYYLSGRPILGLVFKASVMEQLLDELGCAYMVRFHADEPKDAAHEALARFFDAACAGFPSGILPRRNDARFDSTYLAESLTARQSDLFARALNHRTQ